MKLNLKKVHSKCGWHEEAILNSKMCGCFHCLELYEPKDISEWIEEPESCPRGAGKTAICPKCGINSVLPDSVEPDLDLALLKVMHKAYFK